jgi:hypothetical protein
VKRLRLRRPSPRLPFIVLLAAAISGAVVQARMDEDRAATAAGTRTASAAPGAMPTAASDGVLASTWYCAAGTGDEGGMADHVVTILNPSADDLDATVTVYGGVLASTSPTTAEAPAGPPPPPVPPALREVRIPARDRVELRVGDVVPAPMVAALVEVGGGAVAVEHRVSGPHGADAGPCASATAPVWHLASGATTRDARDVVALFNPFPTDAIVDVSFETDAGSREPVRFQGFPVAAGSIVGVDIGDDVAREGQVSATLRVRAGRLVVERLQEFDGSLGPEGLSVALGVPEAATSWAFADGAVGEGLAERIVVYNPGDERAQVDVQVLPTTEDPAPAPQPFRLSVRAGAFASVDYGAEDRVATSIGHATVVRATNGVPVVAERVVTQTVAADEEEGGHSDGGDDEEPSGDAGRVGDIAAGPGSVVAAGRWAFPSGGAGDGSQLRFVVFNPDAERSARVTLLAVVDGRVSGPDGARAVEVPPGGRVTLGSGSADGSWLVASTAPVVAERVVVGDRGLRVAAGVGIPSVDGAVPLGRLVEG